MNTSSKRAAGLCALLATTAICGLAAPAHAQSQPSIYKNIDGNGVDLTDGSFNLAMVEGSIGAGEGALALMRFHGTGGQQDNLSVDFNRSVSGGTASISLTFGNSREEFSGVASATSFASAQGSGATLTKTGPSDYRYTDAGGTVTVYGPPPGLTDAANNGFCSTGNELACSLVAVSTTAPNGAATAYEWDVGENCIEKYDRYGEPYYECAQFWRQRGVSNSFGYAARFAFSQEANPLTGLPPTAWHKRVGATLTNAVAPGAPARTVSYAFPSTTVTEVTDDGGRTWRFTRDSQQRLTGIRRPGSASDDVTITYAGSTSLVVSQIVADGVTTNYAQTVSGTTGTMVVTNALSQQTNIVSDLTIGRPTSVTDPLSRQTSFAYDTSGRLTRTTAPEGNYVNLTYDARGNVTETRSVAKSGSGAADIVSTASYDATCSNIVICNQPNSITEPRGNTTDYSYDATHGGLLSLTAPAPTSGAVRPQTRYAYSLTNSEYQLTSVSACQTTSSCTGAADEVTTTLAYDPNGNVISSSSGNGSGTLTATSAMTYDAYGDLLTIDGPLSGTADTTRFRYNAAREQIGTVGPDPDGGGALKHRATRTTLDSQFRVSKQETGTVNSQSDTDWTGFVALEAVEVGYDANSRPTSSKLTSGSTIYALTQTSYDALGRPECVAQRMNSAVFSSITTDACTLGTQGSDGPDRIVKTIRDAAGQATQVKTALGTADEANEVTSTYSNNGQVATVMDAESNKTTYEQDGHDRLAKTRYPDTTKGASTSSTTDYEQLTYDAGFNVTSVRLRDGNSIGHTFDALGRVTAKDLPGSEPDVTYTYDALSRMTGASQTGHALSFTYDPLGRTLTQVGPLGTVTSTYDIAGRRTRLSHPDGFYVDQDYLVTGEMSAIRENGATSGVGVLATFAYDDLGRRTALTRGNGTTASYSFDAVSRLAQLNEDLGGTTHDLTLGFSYNAASQIVGNTRSNDAYAWTGHGNGTTSSTANGLNQLSTHGGASPTHDAKGNMTSDGVKTYGYSSENLLTAAGSNGWLKYDPLMRLYESGVNGSTRVGYDGHDRIGDYNQANAQYGRYVHGPGMDEPLVSYEGAGLATRRFLHADERGSIVARSNDSGALVNVNTFDEYGKVGSTNAGRFHYAGQPYETMSDLYYSRARMLNPRLGRFMQTDPIGYGGGMNMYAYVGGDPINLTDPSGLFERGDTLFKKRFDGASGTTGGGNPGQGGSKSLPPCPAGSICVTGTRPGGNLSDFRASFGEREGLPSRHAVAQQPNSQDNSRRLDNCGSEASFGTFRRAANSAFAAYPYRPLYSIFPFSVIRGSRIHAQFAGSLKAVGGLYSAEVSYKDGVVVPYGTAGSVRADGVFGPIGSPFYVVELKSGFAIPTPSEIAAYRRNLPPGTGVCGLVEAPGGQ